MGRFTDWTGKKFGQLTVVRISGKDKWGKNLWLCICDCDNSTLLTSSQFTKGHTKSCGCLKKSGDNRVIHGHFRNRKTSPTYNSWSHMLQRCTNPNNKDYHLYGGRGIAVCQRWRMFANFLEDMGMAPSNFQIDRINNDKGYDKHNCRWATRKQNCRNRRTNRLITLGETTMCLEDWAEHLGIHTGTLRRRIDKYNWSLEKALTTPPRRAKP